MQFLNANDYFHVGFTTDESKKNKFVELARKYVVDVHVTEEHDMGIVYHLWAHKVTGDGILALLEVNALQ